MLEFIWPAMGILAPLPLVVRWLSRRRRREGDAEPAIRYPLYLHLQQGVAARSRRRSLRILPLLATWTVWLLLVGAAARPTWVGEPVPVPQAGRDLLLAVDISQSMREQDMEVRGNLVTRLEAVKAVVSDFVQRRSGDRLGLVLFGEQGYLQTPLTFDRDTVEQQLLEALPGFAGNATAIGDAIGLSVKRLRDRPTESRVVILLTDGANTAGTDPIKAAGVAAEAGIRIHTIGIGAEAKVVESFFGLRSVVNPSADLDEESLQRIADMTGGRYFRARNPQELERIYQTLDQLEPVPEDVTYRPRKSLFHWPLGAALAIATLWALINLLASVLPSLRQEGR